MKLRCTAAFGVEEDLFDRIVQGQLAHALREEICVLDGPPTERERRNGARQMCGS